MVIKKYLHSCIVLEQNGKRLLIDPGIFSFLEEKIKPEDIGPVDTILLTHKHPDHYYPEALKKISALRKTLIITHAEVGELLDQEGLEWEEIKIGESKESAGFRITALEAPHGHLPIPCPHHLAYLVNEKILLPGDSYSVVGLDACEILTLPIAGPWSRLSDGIDFAKKLRPRIVIPIHDVIIKDFMLERMYTMCRLALEGEGIDFHPLDLGESCEI